MATAASVFRDFEVDGVPASGKHKPKKSEIRTLLKWYEDIMSALGLADGFQGAWDASTGSFPSGAQKGYSWIASTPGTVGGKYFGEGDQLVAIVNSPSTSTYADNWVVIPAWTNGVVAGVDAGAGTANAIQITTAKPVNDDTIVVFSLFEDTTSSPVTVSVNGGSALTLKSNRGNNASALTAGMEVWGRIRSSDNTFRLLNDQDVSALVGQAEEALAEFEKRYLGAKASDPSVDNEGNALIEGALYWNSSLGKMRVYHSSAWEDFGSVADGSVTNTKLAAMADGTIKGRTSSGSGAPEDLTPAQARAILDPLRDFNADGTTDDTANFTALRAAYPATEFDLKGQDYAVDDFPVGPLKNGRVSIPNVEYGIDVLHALPGYRKSLRSRITRSDRYCSWPQDKMFVYNGVIHACWMEGSSHGGREVHTRMARSYDGGQTWTKYERPFRSATESCMPFARGQVQGQDIIIVRREGSGGESTRTHKMYGRRLYERRYVTCTIETYAAGSSNAFIGIPSAGVKPGDRVNIAQFTGGSVGGATLSGVYTVSQVYESGFRVNLGSTPTAASGERSFRIDFLEDAYAEMQFSGVDFGTAFNTAAAIAGPVTLFHSFAGDDAGSGEAYIGVHGGGLAGPALVKLDFLLRADRHIDWVEQIGGLTTGVEPTVKRDGAGRLFGFIRTQSRTSYPCRFFWRDTDGTYTVTDGPGNGFGFWANIPLQIVGSKIFAFMSDDRVMNEADAGVPHSVPFYLLSAEIDDAVSEGFSAFKIEKLFDGYYAGYLGLDSQVSGVGVTSMCYMEEQDKLCLFYGDEGPNINLGSAPSHGQPDIWCLIIPGLNRQAPGFDAISGLTSFTPEVGSDATGDKDYDRVFAANVPRFVGRFSSTGGKLAGVNLQCTKSATGQYDVSFINDYGEPLDVGNAVVLAIATPYNNSGYYASTSSLSSTGVRVHTRNGEAAGVAADSGFTVEIFVIEDIGRWGP